MEAGLADSFHVSGCKPLQQSCSRQGLTPAPAGGGPGCQLQSDSVPSAPALRSSLLAPASGPTGFRVPTVPGETRKPLSAEQGCARPGRSASRPISPWPRTRQFCGRAVRFQGQPSAAEPAELTTKCPTDIWAKKGKEIDV